MNTNTSAHADNMPSVDNKLSTETWQQKTGFYFVPNVLTLGALLAAFFAITEAINGNYEHSGWAIIAALLLDGIDGRVARLTGKQGAFGEQLDSIADMVSFGVAPALIAYMSLLNSFGQFGYMVAFVYCACAALRLALFNTLIDVADKKWFTGLPSPSAASIVVGYVWMWYVYFSDNESVKLIAVFITLFAGFSMIIPIKFWSFKGLEKRKIQNYNNWFVLIMLLLLFATETPVFYFSFFFLYTFIGYFWALRRYLKGVRTFPI